MQPMPFVSLHVFWESEFRNSEVWVVSMGLCPAEVFLEM